jgi:serine/threonine-protein kinase
VDDLRERLKAALAARYVIERPLGEGGMSAVFLARELQPPRYVALKVLRPELADAVGPERFVREVELVSNLTHPHIVPIFASGEAGGLLYYTMPYVEGESLRQRLEREKQLPLDEALRIGRDVAEALDYAHRHGVVHRDIKPGNILLQDGRAMVADFGIARAVQKAGATKVTTSGVIVGTPQYMSPEQAAGGEVDRRSDLYSLACVIYEMLAGQAPFTGPTTESVIHQLLTAIPRPVTELRPGVPAALAEVLTRALAKTPADRFTTAARFAEALALPAVAGVAAPAAGETPSRQVVSAVAEERRVGRGRRPVGLLRVRRSLLALLAASALVAVAVNLWRARRAAFPTHRIAVAVFENLTGDPALAPLGRMAADWVTQGLARTGLADVVPVDVVLQSADLVPARAARAQAGWAEVLSEEAGAELVVTGAYYREGDSLRFQARLTDTRRHRLLQGFEPVSGSVRAPLQAIEALRQRVIGGLASQLDPRLSASAQASSRPPSYQAYLEVVQGQEAIVRRDWQGAVAHFRQAAARDTTYAYAMLGAGIGYLNLGQPAPVDSIARILERRRAELAPLDRVVLDWISTWLRGDLQGGLERAREAAALAPGSLWSYQQGLQLLLLGRAGESIRVLERLDPQRGGLRGWVPYWETRAAAYHLVGEHGKELALARRARRLYPDSSVPLLLELRALAALGARRELLALVGKTVAPAVGSDPAMEPVLLDAARELRAHGGPEAARELVELALRAPAAEASDSPRGADTRRGAALYLAGRWDEASRVFERALAADPRDVHALGYLGTIAARRGDQPAARDYLRRLEQLDTPYLRGANTYWQADIAALLGDRSAALRLLRQAFQQGQAIAFKAHSDPDLELLRQDPEFARLVGARW